MRRVCAGRFFRSPVLPAWLGISGNLCLIGSIQTFSQVPFECFLVLVPLRCSWKHALVPAVLGTVVVGHLLGNYVYGPHIGVDMFHISFFYRFYVDAYAYNISLYKFHIGFWTLSISFRRFLCFAITTPKQICILYRNLKSKVSCRCVHILHSHLWFSHRLLYALHRFSQVPMFSFTIKK